MSSTDQFSFLTDQGNCFLVGIKGVGMTSLALMLKDKKWQVSGADYSEEFITDEILRQKKIGVVDFDQAVLPANTQVVVYSGANQGKNNPIVKEAVRRRLPIFSLSQAVGLLSAQKDTIAVCGVGGKTTTTAMLAWILEFAGHKPAFAVGTGNLGNFGVPARWTTGSKFVVEADEYVADPTSDLTPRLMYLEPKHTICTSLKYDHPDVYASFEQTKQVFQDFFKLLPEASVKSSYQSQQSQLVINGDDPNLVAITENLSVRPITVGFQPHNLVRLSNRRVTDGVGRLDLAWNSTHDVGIRQNATISSTIPGFHNLLNATYAVVMSVQLGVELERAVEAIRSFKSVQRRFSLVGKTPHLLCYDDYAHHPHELAAVAQTIKAWFLDRPVTVAFEPHTYSRTKALFNDFVDVFQDFPAEVWLLPIFASAREATDSQISSLSLVEALNQLGKPARYIKDYQELLQCIGELEPGGVFITLGAGTIYKVFENVQFDKIDQ